MRKQTKVVAVASAAALLAIGASMTSFAATGWTEEDGSWYYYDSDGNRVEDDWKKSGDNWFWLDSEESGAMATDKLIEDGDDTYYVDANGAMVRNTWVMVVNEDQDDEDDPAEYNYYYFQSNGKAYKWDNNSVKKRTIDGKKYAFDEDGKMLYGWVDADGKRVTGDTDWKDALYYFGEWTDGSMKTGWQQINVYDAYGDADDDADKWFYFKANGKKTFKTSDNATNDSDYTTSTINGHKYSFDANGVMIYKWNQIASEAGVSTAANYAWYGTAQDGARVNKGWFKVVPKNTFDLENSEDGDDEAQWYYSESDGTLVTGQIKKIKGKYYAFDDKGAMISGLVLLETNNGVVESVVDDDVDSDDLDDLKDGTFNSSVRLYYFGDSDNADTDGAMKTGNVTINVDGDNHSFNFTTSGGTDTKGAGTNGLYKKVYYKYGIKMAASSDDKYRAAKIDPDTEIVTFVKSSDVRTMGADTVVYNAGKSNQETIKYAVPTEELYLIGTNGQLAKKKGNGVKDGDDWYFYSNADGKIVYYANSKNLEKAFEQNNKTWGCDN